ncbi:MAG TPA: BNR-4 repeat-containing protein, partial [Elusimicrobiota bacterium]|nr:BNR-4 repeat-containing protein [Elusimicrobiota bacterium]
FRSERQQYGYRPAFTPNPVGFCSNGRVMIRDSQLDLQFLEDDGTWKSISLLDAARRSLEAQGYRLPDWDAYAKSGSTLRAGARCAGIACLGIGSGPFADERVAADDRGGLYTLIDGSESALRFAVLLHSPDGGRSWAAYPLTAPGVPFSSYTAHMEVPSSPGPLKDTPAILIHEKAASHGADDAFLRRDPASGRYLWSWTTPNDLYLVVPKRNRDGSLSLPSPRLVSTGTICCGEHSGSENQAVSAGDSIFIAYPGDQPLRDPVAGRWGTPEYIVEFSRKKGAVVTPRPLLLGIGFDGPAANDNFLNPRTKPPLSPPYADDHDQPALAIGRDGRIRAIVGGHDARLRYLESKRPRAIDRGWSAPRTIGVEPNRAMPDADEYTYPSLMLDAGGSPNVVARWAGAHYHFSLAYLRFDSKTSRWEQRLLVDPGRPYYGVWYHRLSVDPSGRLFLSDSYFPQNLFADEARIFAAAWDFPEMAPAPAAPGKAPCPLTDSGAPGSNYCPYIHYGRVSPSILMSPGGGRPFRLATTHDFFVSSDGKP